MVAFTFNMPTGIPGVVNRIQSAHVEAQLASTAAGTFPTSFGMGLVMDATTGMVRLPVAGDAPAPGGLAYGLLVRPYPTHGPAQINEPLGGGTPLPSGICNVLKRGYMTVLLRGAVAAVRGAPVYVWKAAAAGGQVPGGITADGTTPASVMLLPGYFLGAADASGITEIALNI